MRGVGRWWNEAKLYLALSPWVPDKWYHGALVAVVAALLGAWLVPAIWPDIHWAAPTAALNQGFGPDWECAYVPGFSRANVCSRKTTRALPTR